MAKVLIIEDDVALAAALVNWFSTEGHRAESTENGADGLQLLLYSGFDLALIDWQLPELSGTDICRQYRQRGGRMPILMMTSKSHSVEKAEGLDSGADDYLSKPFDMREFAARVRALLRRSTGYFESSSQSGLVSLDQGKCQVTIRGKRIQLVPKEFDVLEFLFRHANNYISSERMIAHVWDSDADVSTEALRMCILRLRKKIEDPDHPPLLESSKGLGYKLTIPE